MKNVLKLLVLLFCLLPVFLSPQLVHASGEKINIVICDESDSLTTLEEKLLVKFVEDRYKNLDCSIVFETFTNNNQRVNLNDVLIDEDAVVFSINVTGATCDITLKGKTKEILENVGFATSDAIAQGEKTLTTKTTFQQESDGLKVYDAFEDISEICLTELKTEMKRLEAVSAQQEDVEKEEIEQEKYEEQTNPWADEEMDEEIQEETDNNGSMYYAVMETLLAGISELLEMECGVFTGLTVKYKIIALWLVAMILFNIILPIVAIKTEMKEQKKHKKRLGIRSVEEVELDLSKYEVEQSYKIKYN